MPIKPKDFKWKHFQASIILWAVRWYSRFAISYRDLAVMAQERALSITHTTLMRWVHEYAPKLEKKIKPHLKRCNDSYRVDETYIKIKGIWQYLYRAVDSDGKWVEISRNGSPARRFATVPKEYKRAPKEWVRSELFGARSCYFCGNSEPDGHTADCEHPRAIAARKKAAKAKKEPRP